MFPVLWPVRAADREPGEVNGVSAATGLRLLSSGQSSNGYPEPRCPATWGVQKEGRDPKEEETAEEASRLGSGAPSHEQQPAQPTWKPYTALLSGRALFTQLPPWEPSTFFR